MRGTVLGSFAVALTLLGGPSGLPAQQDPSPPGDEGAQQNLPGPLDSSRPAFETYRGWPPPELEARFQPLPWSRFAFQRAALFGRPVFLVLTVGWNRAAQELAQTGLRDTEVVRKLNAGYIPVVVNADLRPDLRERYQTGAWPVIAFLLPDGGPVLSRVNERGASQPITSSVLEPAALRFLLHEGTVYWEKWRETLISAGAAWVAEEGPALPDAGAVDAAASEVLARWMLGNADAQEGGFGGGPKFLVNGLDEFAALRQARGLAALRQHTRRTLEVLVESPLFDSREGGTHRMAGAPSFGEIQYEKLLSDNAQLLRELVVSLRSEESPALRQALVETAGFLLRRLARPGGGFYLAHAADPRAPDGGGFWTSGAGDPPPVVPLVLSGPNAEAGAALLRAGMLLDDASLVEAGRGAIELVLERGHVRGRGVLHSIEPAADQRIYLGTQADVALALADAFEATGERRYLAASRDIVEFVQANLKDPKDTSYRDHLPDAQPIGLLRNERRPLVPNVRLARAMLRLELLGEGAAFRTQALSVLGTFAGDLSVFGVHGTEAALAVEETLGEPLRARVDGPPGAPAVLALRRAAVNSPWPFTVVLTGPSAGAPAVELRLGGTTRRVEDPARLHEAIRELTGGSDE